MSPRWRSVCAAALATEAVSLWCSQSPRTSMAGTLGSTTNCSLQKLRKLHELERKGLTAQFITLVRRPNSMY
jgi:hypothetical protein